MSQIHLLENNFHFPDHFDIIRKATFVILRNERSALQKSRFLLSSEWQNILPYNFPICNHSISSTSSSLFVLYSSLYHLRWSSGGRIRWWIVSRISSPSQSVWSGMRKSLRVFLWRLWRDLWSRVIIGSEKYFKKFAISKIYTNILFYNYKKVWLPYLNQALSLFH